jgi:hypothetical protein
MRCAKNRVGIEEQIRNGVADLSLNEAAAMLALSSNMKKLFDFVQQLQDLSDPEDMMQLCLDSGVAQYAGTLDYESGYSVEQRREWDVFMLFMVRLGCLACDADDHVRWLKRRDYQTPSEWMGEEGDKDRKRYPKWVPQVSDQVKQQWKDLLAQTATLDRFAIHKLIGKADAAPAPIAFRANLPPPRASLPVPPGS